MNRFEYLLGSANLVTTASPIRVGNRLNAAQQISFHSDITAEEIEAAVRQMNGEKVTGGGTFFQHCWHIIGADVTRACLNFFRSKKMLKQLNSTFLCLIPKKDNPSRIDDNRPISLCHFLYKILSKILANRLRGVLDSLVGPHQTAFVKGRNVD